MDDHAAPAFLKVSDDDDSRKLAEQAARCRRLARATTDPEASKILTEMARDYAASAATLRDED